jgi:hypothetical protein
VANLTAQAVPAAGLLDVTLTAADAGLSDQCDHSNTIALLLVNGGGSTCNISITSNYVNALGSTSADNDQAIVAGDTALIPLTNANYKNSGTGKVDWTYDQVASVTVAVVNRW